MLQKRIAEHRNFDHKKWELIVVADGCTDNTNEYLSYICKEDKRIKSVILRENSSCVSIPRAIGITHSSGTYICHHDDDVIQTPDKLSILANELDNNKDIALVYGDRLNIYRDKEIVKLSGITGTLISAKDDELVTVVKTPSWNPEIGPGVDGGQIMYRAYVYNKIPLVFCRRACDWHTAKNIAVVYPNIKYVSTPVCGYIWHLTNRSRDDSTRDKKIYPAKFKKYFNNQSGKYTIVYEEV